MSKITLEPNDSGAGTFSIVSPDSNTNRTLTLPDEAGKILSTGNNDPAEVFKQSNILGTVSQSGGVPTGAIIERGSNANGEFVKYADGTMICTRLVNVDLTITSSQVFSWASVFQIGPACSFSGSGASAADLGAYFNAVVRNVNVTEFIFQCDGSGDSTSRPVRFLGIGLWF